MADEPDAFAGVDGEIDAGKRADGAEMLFDAVQLDDMSGVASSHYARCTRRGPSTAARPIAITSYWP